MSDKVNVRNLAVNLGTEKQDMRYAVEAPTDLGGVHHTITTGKQGEHYSFDTDQDGNVIEESGHYTGPEPTEGEQRIRKTYDPPTPAKPGVKVVFNPDCLWD